MRDLTSIYSKLLQVLYPPKSGGSNELLREWDLWGPLVICLSLAIVLSLDVSGEHLVQLRCSRLTVPRRPTERSGPVDPGLLPRHLAGHGRQRDCDCQR